MIINYLSGIRDSIKSDKEISVLKSLHKRFSACDSQDIIKQLDKREDSANDWNGKTFNEEKILGTDNYILISYDISLIIHLETFLT